jgi:hypothetical protein
LALLRLKVKSIAGANREIRGVGEVFFEGFPKELIDKVRLTFYLLYVPSEDFFMSRKPMICLNAFVPGLRGLEESVFAPFSSFFFFFFFMSARPGF